MLIYEHDDVIVHDKVQMNFIPAHHLESQLGRI